MVKNPPCNAGDKGSVPGGRTKIPHASDQLSLQPTVTELAHSRARVPQVLKPMSSGVHAPQQKMLRDAVKILSAAVKTQHNQINN